MAAVGGGGGLAEEVEGHGKAADADADDGAGGEEEGVGGAERAGEGGGQHEEAGEEVGPLPAVAVAEGPPDEAAEQLAPEDGEAQVGEHGLGGVDGWMEGWVGGRDWGLDWVGVCMYEVKRVAIIVVIMMEAWLDMTIKDDGWTDGAWGGGLVGMRLKGVYACISRSVVPREVLS